MASSSKPDPKSKNQKAKRKPFSKKEGAPLKKEDKPLKKNDAPPKRERGSFNPEKTPFKKEGYTPRQKDGEYPKKPFGNKRAPKNTGFSEKDGNSPPKKERGSFNSDRTPFKKEGYTPRQKDSTYPKKKFEDKKAAKNTGFSEKEKGGPMRLNKFLSNAGVASRREADRLIQLGLVSVNGTVIRELGIKVDPQKDVVKYDDVKLKPESMRYVLLNKPKDYITTMDDPEERHTVMELIREACKERVYPVGRLDRNTTGLLLFTNDGDLARRLTHPKNGFPKLYHVETNEKVTVALLEKMRAGVHLEDGFIQVDEAEFVGDGADPKQVGIRIHSGQNRIVRRIFEHLGLTIKKLDRVMFAGLTKKDLPRGRYRHLSEKEVSFLKMIR